MTEYGCVCFSVQCYEFVSPLSFDDVIGFDEGGAFSGGVGEDVRGETIVLVVWEFGEMAYVGFGTNSVVGE